MNSFCTEQELFWAGDFGDEYCKRNSNEQMVANNIAFFAKALEKTKNIESIIEFGANIGLNLRALKQLYPQSSIAALEINQYAITELAKLELDSIYPESALTFKPTKQYDLAFTKVMLIHIAPEQLDTVYRNLYDSSKQYILIAEYYNTTPVTADYRGNANKLFKRDFAFEMQNKFKDLKMIDYGFVYHNDKLLCQDDITWFLFKKNG